MDDQQFAARLRAFDQRHAQFIDRLDVLDQQFYKRFEESDRRFQESERRSEEFDRRFQESERRSDEFDRRFQESQRRFAQKLDDFDLGDTALLQRLERLREQVDLLTGQSGQVADDLVEHKRDRDAHG